MKIRIRFPAWSSTFRRSLPSFQVPDCPLTVPAAINQEGVVVGVCANSQGSPDSIQGFIRDPKGRFTLLPELRPTDINVHGAITGVSGVPNFGAFLRSPSGEITLFGVTYAPVAINARGQIAGFQPGSPTQAFLREPDGSITVFVPLPQIFTNATATGLNDEGEVVGAAFLPLTDRAQGFLRGPKGGFTLVGPMTAQDDVWALGINNAGAIIGVATTFSNSLPQIITTMGFIQTATGAPKLFPLSRPAYQPGHFRVPYVNGDINSAGATVIQDLYVAPDGTITRIELGSCGDVNAQAINDHGVVVGSCTVPGQPISGFLEPPF